jgi:uncharacterized membrane protein
MRKMAPGIAALLAALAFGIWALPDLPDRVVTHWGLNGEPDGWSSRTTAVFILPAFGLGLAALLAFLPRIDPRRESFPQHASTWWILGNGILVFLSVIHVAALGYSLGWPIPISRIVVIGVGALFILIGNFMTRMRPNWFMGIRTPWTLSSEVAWRKSHRVGGYGFVAGGILAILAGLLRPAWAHWIMLVSIGVTVIGTVIYSYFVWRDETERVRAEAGR